MTSDELNIALNTWIVALMGPREHYMPVRSLEHCGVLRRFYTLVWCRRGRSLVRRVPGVGPRLAGCYHEEIPNDKVVSLGAAGFWELTLFGYYRKLVPERIGQYFRESGERFARSVAGHLEGSELGRKPAVLLAFQGVALETFRRVRGRRIITVLDQTDTGEEYYATVSAEMKRWPGWAASKPELEQAMVARWREEWRVADVIVVNSSWTRRQIVQQGAPAEKIVVVPLAYDLRKRNQGRATSSCELPLRVLWVGNVGLGKGIQYLVDAARKLHPSRFELTVVGPIRIAESAIRSAPANMKFTGAVPRVEVDRFYDWADVYVLPTLSDGFAITQLEAMAHGLPVITTSNCGDVVSDGVDGLIVPARDSEALKRSLERMERDREGLAAMSARALEKVSKFSKESYCGRLVGGVRQVMERRTRSSKRVAS